MINHTHFTDSSGIIHTAARMLAEAYEKTYVEKKKNLPVYGVENDTTVTVIDRVVSSAARSIYFTALPAEEQESALDCLDCKQFFLQILEKHELEISLRIMEALSKKNLPSSCECVEYDPESKNVKAFLRQKASFKTQQVVPIPPVYLGSFERVCEIQQREFAVSSAKATKPILATWHLAECVAVAGFDKNHKIGFLFHIDEGTLFNGGFRQLKHLFEFNSSGPFSFEYIVLGGADTQRQTAHNRKKIIANALESISTTQLSFTRKPYQERVEIPFYEFIQDSYWSQAVRLCRSIALDLTQDDPLSHIMGYEAKLNPFSVFHKRARTSEEAEQFCLTHGPQMNCVYKDYR